MPLVGRNIERLEDRALLYNVDLAGNVMYVGSKSTTWGSTITLNQAMVRNLGSDRAVFSLRWYLSRDSTYSPNDVPLNLAGPSYGPDLPQAGIAGNGYGPRLSYLSLHTATPAPNVDVTPQVAEAASSHAHQPGAGDRVVFYASGMIWAGVWLTGRNRAGGWNNIANDKFPDPEAHAYSLLGCIDGNQYFEIGTGFDKVYTGSSTITGSTSRSTTTRLATATGVLCPHPGLQGLPDGPTGRRDLPGRFRVSRLRHHQHPLAGLEESNARNSGRLVSWD